MSIDDIQSLLDNQNEIEKTREIEHALSQFSILSEKDNQDIEVEYKTLTDKYSNNKSMEESKFPFFDKVGVESPSKLPVIPHKKSKNQARTPKQ